jgi:hypothetical protein
MKINGPYIHSTGKLKGRAYVSIVDGGKKTTMLYSRFLMEQKLGRKLEYDETVDHIDNDFTNDSLSNLQLLSRIENSAKRHVDTNNVIEMSTYECPMCGSEFEKDVRHVKHNRKQGKAGPFCSKSCAGKYKPL